MNDSRETLNPKSEKALDKMKYEVAEDLGLRDDIEKRGWENMTTREVGKIGGNMVRRMVEFAEDEMADEIGPEQPDKSRRNLRSKPD